MEAGLVAADRLYTTKRQILEELGLGGFMGGEGEGADGWHHGFVCCASMSESSRLPIVSARVRACVQCGPVCRPPPPGLDPCPPPAPLVWLPDVRAEFPITQDSITTQQLVYLRLARLQDSAQLAKASGVGRVGVGQGGSALQHVWPPCARRAYRGPLAQPNPDTQPLLALIAPVNPPTYFTHLLSLTASRPPPAHRLPALAPPAPPTPQIDFEQDTIISQENEYEILQIMMGDLRDRWAAVLARPGWGCSWWGSPRWMPPLSCSFGRSSW